MVSFNKCPAADVSTGLHRSSGSVTSLTLQLCSDLRKGVDGILLLVPRLRELKISRLPADDTGTTDEVMEAVANALRRVPQLTHLSIQQVRLSDRGAKSLSIQLQQLPRLTRLDFCHNNIGDDGVRALMLGVKHCRNCVHLDLRDNRFGDRGLFELYRFWAEGGQFMSFNSSGDEDEDEVGSDSSAVKLWMCRARGFPEVLFNTASNRKVYDHAHAAWEQQPSVFDGNQGVQQTIIALSSQVPISTLPVLSVDHTAAHQLHSDMREELAQEHIRMQQEFDAMRENMAKDYEDQLNAMRQQLDVERRAKVDQLTNFENFAQSLMEEISLMGSTSKSALREETRVLAQRLGSSAQSMAERILQLEAEVMGRITQMFDERTSQSEDRFRQMREEIEALRHEIDYSVLVRENRGESGSVAVPEIRLQDLENATDAVRDGMPASWAQLGSGAFGRVFKTTWTKPGGRKVDVAVKVPLSPDNLSKAERDRITREVRILAEVRHRNIVALHGFLPKRGWIVTELMGLDLGNGATIPCLWQFFNRMTRCHLDIPVAWRLQWAHQIAEGMRKLAATSILHRDLKSSNVLLRRDVDCPSEEFQVFQECLLQSESDDANAKELSEKLASLCCPALAKVSDFGEARLSSLQTLNTEGALHGPVGTCAWVAPEIWQRTISPSEKSDVFSFGMMLVELCHPEWGHPWYTICEHDAERMKRLVCDGRRPPVTQDAVNRMPPGFGALMSECWDANPDLRPSFSGIADRLQEMRRQSLLRENL
eukprot:ANDGO_08468.mRNA.1 Putative serine/threonine-protein kinase/receptor R826